MTKVKWEEVKCPFCDTDYKLMHVYSWGIVSGPPKVEGCPKCGKQYPVEAPKDADTDKLKKYPKPWTKEIHDKFIKESGKPKEEHDAWHKGNMPDTE